MKPMAKSQWLQIGLLLAILLLVAIFFPGVNDKARNGILVSLAVVAVWIACSYFFKNRKAKSKD